MRRKARTSRARTRRSTVLNVEELDARLLLSITPIGLVVASGADQGTQVSTNFANGLEVTVENLATGRPVPEYHPVWPAGPNVGRPKPLVFPVVPFPEVGVDLGGRPEPGQLACPPGPDRRAGPDSGEVDAGQPGGQLAGGILALGVERQIGRRREVADMAQRRGAIDAAVWSPGGGCSSTPGSAIGRSIGRSGRPDCLRCR